MSEFAVNTETEAQAQELFRIIMVGRLGVIRSGGMSYEKAAEKSLEEAQKIMYWQNQVLQTQIEEEAP